MEAKKLSLRRAVLQAEGALDAARSVARETDAAIVTPHYTEDALTQMGWARSKGECTAYRDAFTLTYVAEWQARYRRLTSSCT
jgi:hypothetical protein